MAMYVEQERPTIKIFHAKNSSAAMLKELCCGIEEEGIPFILDEAEDGKSAETLAWEAAQASRLDVGIGADAERVILTQVKLSLESPLMVIPASSSNEALRALGGSAGRLVKKLPLKVIESGAAGVAE